jgi:hypothetical protein
LEVHVVSHSPESDPQSYFGYGDISGFIDFVTYVLSCAPELFPKEKWLDPDHQMNLDRAFIGLRYGLTVLANEKVDLGLLEQCRHLIDEAHAEYRAGRDHDGQCRLEEVERVLKKL